MILKPRLGIIAEDHSDIDTLIVMIRRINNIRLKIKRYSAKGCGKLRKKCSGIASLWAAQSISYIIICHDSDCDNPHKIKTLRNNLREKILKIPNCDRVVCIVIPVQELEAWFLADVSPLNKKFRGMNIRNIPNPENIRSPKEFIEKASRSRHCKPRYINTIHNPELSQTLNINAVIAKCPAFQPFYNFVSSMK
jgi:hypothetical protein